MVNCPWKMKGNNLENFVEQEEHEWRKEAGDILRRRLQSVDRMMLGIGEFAGSVVLACAFSVASPETYPYLMPIGVILAADASRRIVGSYLTRRDLDVEEHRFEKKYRRNIFC